MMPVPDDVMPDAADVAAVVEGAAAAGVGEGAGEMMPGKAAQQGKSVYYPTKGALPAPPKPPPLLAVPAKTAPMQPPPLDAMEGILLQEHVQRIRADLQSSHAQHLRQQQYMAAVQQAQAAQAMAALQATSLSRYIVDPGAASITGVVPGGGRDGAPGV